ncbi:MAG: hypothetical protein FWH34_02495 [Desulfovibrionaceae bacterium]|nr:hypothetical protein [Desulfovibrionaceae bacterium]
MKKYFVAMVGFTLSGALFLTGCAAVSRLMIHPETGQTVDCSTAGWGVLGVSTSLISAQSCTNRYKELGFVELSEYRAQGGDPSRIKKGTTPADRAYESFRKCDKWESFGATVNNIRYFYARTVLNNSLVGISIFENNNSKFEIAVNKNNVTLQTGDYECIIKYGRNVEKINVALLYTSAFAQFSLADGKVKEITEIFKTWKEIIISIPRANISLTLDTSGFKECLETAAMKHAEHKNMQP